MLLKVLFSALLTNRLLPKDTINPPFADRMPVAASRSSMTAVSVTSTSSLSGGRPEAASADSTMPVTSPERKSRAEILMDTRTSAGQLRHSRVAVLSRLS